MKVWALPFTHHLRADHQDVVHAFEDMDANQRAEVQKLLNEDEGLKAVFDKMDAQQQAIVEAHAKLIGETDEEQEDLRMLLATPASSPTQRIWEVFENVAGAAAGRLEITAADVKAAERLLDSLRAKRIRSYTYRVSPRLLRGSRPSPGKLESLYKSSGIRSTVNLCREMHKGDSPYIASAQLAAELKTLHIPITDNEQPKFSQVLQFLEFLDDASNCPAYVHCEQGVGRTGVMTGCFRIAVNGWPATEALAEAKRFADGEPDQLKFIELFDRELRQGDSWGAVFRSAGYPRQEPPRESRDTATRDSCLDHP